VKQKQHTTRKKQNKISLHKSVKIFQQNSGIKEMSGGG
jgi:hypothetical protein